MSERTRIEIRLSPDDLRTIRANAERHGMTVSQYIRDYSLIPRTSPRLPDIVVRAVAGFGRLLNQLAHRANEAQDAPAVEAVEALRADAARIIAELEQIGTRTRR